MGVKKETKKQIDEWDLYRLKNGDISKDIRKKLKADALSALEKLSKNEIRAFKAFASWYQWSH